MSLTEQCSRCHAPIRWVRTASGKAMPVNAEPDPKGNLRLENGVALYVPKGDPIAAGQPLYTSHFSNCPFAAQFRKPKEVTP